MTPDSNLLYPLNEFYEQAGLPLPPAVQVAAREVPEPYRSLLVHEREMTPTLEVAYRRIVPYPRRVPRPADRRGNRRAAGNPSPVLLLPGLAQGNRAQVLISVLYL